MVTLNLFKLVGDGVFETHLVSEEVFQDSLEDIVTSEKWDGKRYFCVALLQVTDEAAKVVKVSISDQQVGFLTPEKGVEYAERMKKMSPSIKAVAVDAVIFHRPGVDNVVPNTGGSLQVILDFPEVFNLSRKDVELYVRGGSGF